MREQLLFLNSFIKRPAQVGAVAPSGRALCRMLVDSFEWNSIRHVIEFGPGTGVVTELILPRLHEEAKFFAIERSAQLARSTRLRCPKAEIVEDCVTNVQRLCQERGFTQVDAIVSGLPWASFKSSLQRQIFEAMFQVLRPGGQFATFAYLQGMGAAASVSRLLRQNFSNVSKSRTVWRNLPPAIVYRCVR